MKNGEPTGKIGIGSEVNGRLHLFSAVHCRKDDVVDRRRPGASRHFTVRVTAIVNTQIIDGFHYDGPRDVVLRIVDPADALDAAEVAPADS